MEYETDHSNSCTLAPPWEEAEHKQEVVAAITIIRIADEEGILIFGFISSRYPILKKSAKRHVQSKLKQSKTNLERFIDRGLFAVEKS